MNVAEYWWGSYNRHDPRRDRKLLLTKRELRKLLRATREKGMTIVAVKLFIIFFVLKIFFFPSFLKHHAAKGQEASYVMGELEKRALEPSKAPPHENENN